MKPKQSKPTVAETEAAQHVFNARVAGIPDKYRSEIYRAFATLRDTDRGRRVLKALSAFFDNSGSRQLDTPGFEALALLFHRGHREFADTVPHMVRISTEADALKF